MKNKVIGVILGSRSDLELGQETAKVLSLLKIGYELSIFSAHRTPDKLRKYAKNVEMRGVKVVIALCGAAAHLPGVIASYTTLPVIGVPLSGSELKGIDSLLSIVQMPKGVPVATVSLGKAGAINAAILAAEILALEDVSLRKRLKGYREQMSKEVEKQNQGLGEISL